MTERAQVMPRSRHIAWCIYGMVCMAVLLFPPWIVSHEGDSPQSFGVEWFFSYDFHFWSDQPVQHSVVHGHPAYGAMVTTKLFKQLNYAVFGIEILLLDASGLLLYRIIPWRDPSLSKQPADNPDPSPEQRA